DLARKFCMLGATNEDLAKCFEVARGTIDHWIDTIQDFADAVHQGRERADAAVIQKLYSRAMGFTHETKKHVLYRGEVREVPHTPYSPPDPGAGMFGLRNGRRKHWRDKPQRARLGGPSSAELQEAGERARRVVRQPIEHAAQPNGAATDGG